LQRENAEQVVGEMPTDGFQVIGRCGVQQQPNSLADRLVAAEFIEKLNDEIGMERRIKLVHHENSPPAPIRGSHGPFSFIKAERRLSTSGMSSHREVGVCR
jgi:hypothetical protein